MAKSGKVKLAFCIKYRSKSAPRCLDMNNRLHIAEPECMLKPVYIGSQKQMLKNFTYKLLSIPSSVSEFYQIKIKHNTLQTKLV